MRRPFLVIAMVIASLFATSGAALASQETASNDEELVYQSTFYFKQNPDGSVSPTQYPTGCGLTVLISRVGNFIDGDVITGCNFAVASIEHSIEIQRSRWYGWETMATLPSDIRFNTSSHSSFQNYNCAGTGIHDFRVIGRGQVIPYGGSPATAAAYDQLNEQNCG
ncbi:hypothetical protein ACWGRK_15915 [Saccharomonospora azurea]|nr:hypothetical protein [Saccharomonospora cyanea]